MIFDIVITQKCNLSCKYCFEEKKEDNSLSKSKIFDIIKFIRHYMKNDYVINKDEIIVNFNGGEALFNFDTISAFIKETEDFVTRYSVSTNFSYVTKEMLDFFDKKKVALHISIDGKKKTNDKNRIDCLGNSYYKTLISNLNMVISYKNIPISLSMVYTPETISDLSRNVIYLYKKGFRKIHASYASNYFWSESKEKVLINEIRKLSKFYLQAYRRNNPFFLSLFTSKIDNIMRLNVDQCGAFIDQITLMPDGKIIPCLGFMGNKLTTLIDYGNWDDTTVVNTPNILQFRKRVDDTKTLCKECAFSNNCHKSCIFELELSNKSVSAMNCIVTQTTIIESEKIIANLIKTNNSSFMNEYQKYIDKIEVL